jgi:hypothetical protein
LWDGHRKGGHFGAWKACYRNLAWPESERLDYRDFFRKIRKGHTVAVDISEGKESARMGVELMIDAGRPYISVQYYEGSFKREWLKPLGRYLLLLSRIWQITCNFEGFGRCYLVGRPAWHRLIKNAGIPIENGYWIDGNNRRVRALLRGDDYGY